MDAVVRTLPKTFKLITVRGDNGRGCYAGVEVVIAKIIKLPFFWLDFFAQKEAEEHDMACAAIDWSNPEQAYIEYRRCTLDFHAQCLLKAGDVTQLIWDSQIAYWFAMRFGDFCYGISRK